MIIRKAYKSKIKVSKEQKVQLDSFIFINNQVYNFLIEKLYNKKFQKEIINLDYAKLIDQTSLKNNISKKFIISNKSKIRNYLLPMLKDYFHKRKISTSGMSKIIQLKIENFLDNFNKIYLSGKQNHNFKFTSSISDGGFITNSSIKLIKKRYKTSKGKKKTQYFVKIGRELFPFCNNRLNIKRFELKLVSLTRKNGKYYISLSGKENIPELILNKNSNIGIDVNFENITLSNKDLFLTKNFQLKLNLYTKELEKLKVLKSKRVEINREVLKTVCSVKNISIYDKRVTEQRKYKITKRAKKLFKEILYSDKELRLLKIKINKMYIKRVNIQEDFYKKLSSKLTTRYDFCFIEKLNIENMVNKDVNNQNLYNASMGKFLTILRNKASTTGKSYIEVDSYNTSKRCSNCTKVNEELKVFEKEWTCKFCGIKHNRDYNASKNIQKLGLIKLREVSIK